MDVSIFFGITFSWPWCIGIHPHRQCLLLTFERLCDLDYTSLAATNITCFEIACARPHHLPSHIAGALFGAVYYFYGFEFWNKLRLKCLEWQKKEKEILTAERG